MGDHPRWPNHDDLRCSECCADCLAELAKDTIGCPRHCGMRRPKTVGHLCRKPRGWGTDHAGYGTCKQHLGTTQNFRVAAQHERVQAVAAKFGVPRQVDPEQAMRESLWCSAGLVAWYESGLGDIADAAELVHEGGNGHRRPTPEFELYLAERDRYFRYAKGCVEAGLREREVAVAEEHGRQFADLLRVVTDGMCAVFVARGVPDELVESVRRQEVPTLVRKALSPLAAGGPMEAA